MLFNGTYSHKEKKKAKLARITGIAAIVLVTVLCYVFGSMYINSESFYFVTGKNLFVGLNTLGLRYYAMLLSMAPPLIFYILKFGSIRDTEEGSVAFTRYSGQRFIYDGWTLGAVLTAIGAALMAVVIYWIAFRNNWLLVVTSHVMVWVWIAQTVLSFLCFAVPLFQPMKKAHS